MAELIKTGAVFIHVPKCGGTWVREALRDQGLLRGRIGFKHSTTDRINHILRYHGGQFVKHWVFRPTLLPRALKRARKFCFVRHPVTWYESWWKFQAGRWEKPEPGRWHPQRIIDECGDDDFNRFVENVIDRRPGYVSEMLGWYTDGAAYVGRFERLADDLMDILGSLGVPFDERRLREFPRVNVSTPPNDQPRWDPQLLHTVMEVEAEGIERYGYVDEMEPRRTTFTTTSVSSPGLDLVTSRKGYG